MDEKYPQSKLKRKRRNPQTQASANVKPEADGSVWWSREHLPAAHSLWAFMLTSALSSLDDQRHHLVPDLPHPSTERRAASQLDEQRWCDLRDEVAPLPEPAPPSTSPDPLGLASSQQDVSMETEAAVLQDHTKKPRPSHLGCEEATSAAGCSRVAGGERGAEASPVQGQLLTKQVEQRENDEEEVRSLRGDGEGRLQSCPMCLLVFPAGFTQMDCDGHLAQCLSEMNMDMTW